MFLFVANFKMNPVTVAEVEEYIRVLGRESNGKEWKHAKGVLCPSTLHLAHCNVGLKHFSLGAQHGFPEKSGSFTGEISFAMLKNFGVDYVIIGHSERRAYFGENNETVQIRTEAALKYLLQPIVCVGETQEELQAGKREVVLAAQIESVLKNLSKMQAEKIIFAYEPRYAIGTDLVPESKDIEGVRKMIYTLLTERLGEASAQRIQILYGGSVKASNLQEVALQTGMDGVLVGRESLSPYEVVKMMDLGEKYQQK